MSLIKSISTWLRQDLDSARHSQKVGWTPISKTSFNALHSPGVFTNQNTFFTPLQLALTHENEKYSIAKEKCIYWDTVLIRNRILLHLFG